MNTRRIARSSLVLASLLVGTLMVAPALADGTSGSTTEGEPLPPPTDVDEDVEPIDDDEVEVVPVVDEVDRDELAVTGGDLGPLALTGGLLALGGAAIVLVSRRGRLEATAPEAPRPAHRGS